MTDCFLVDECSCYSLCYTDGYFDSVVKQLGNLSFYKFLIKIKLKECKNVRYLEDD